jgi:hypothetical protein
MDIRKKLADEYQNIIYQYNKYGRSSKDTPTN